MIDLYINFSIYAYIFLYITHCENNEFEIGIILNELKTFAVPIFRSSGCCGPGF